VGLRSGVVGFDPLGDGEDVAVGIGELGGSFAPGAVGHGAERLAAGGREGCCGRFGVVGW
jgi:hypothetical protein